MKAFTPQRALFEAILDGDLARTKSALGHADANAGLSAADGEWFVPGIARQFYRGDTALHAAAAGRRVEIATFLLAAGATANPANRRRARPLHYACDGRPDDSSRHAGRQIELVRLLLAAGAELNARDGNGATPLHRAVRTRCASVVPFLLAAGADPVSTNLSGSTPFHLAVQNTGKSGSGGAVAKEAQRAIIGAFLNHGVRPELKDARGRSVRQWASEAWVEALLSRGSL